MLYDLYNAGFAEVRVDGKYHRLSERVVLARYKPHTIELVVDRVPLGWPIEGNKGLRGQLAEAGVRAGLVNCRFIKPMDLLMLSDLAERYRILITLEENTIRGGFGSGVHEALLEIGLVRGGPRLHHLGLPDAFISHGGRAELFEEAGLSISKIAAFTLEALKSQRADG